MGNRLLNGRFTSGLLSPWSNFGPDDYQLELDDDEVVYGPRSMRVGISHEIGGDEYALARAATLPVSSGDPYHLRFRVKCSSVNVKFSLLVIHRPSGLGGPSLLAGSLLASTLPTGWNAFDYTVTPTSSEAFVELWPQASPGFYVDDADWYFDDLFYGDDEDLMSIKLAERGVGSIIALLRSVLGTELGLIDTDRADSITMAVPASADYHGYVLDNIKGADSHVEVFEGELDFADNQTDLASERATYDLPITIRVTWFNRNQDDMDDMVTRGRRYASGVYNSLIKNQQMADADDGTKLGRVVSVTPAYADIGSDDNSNLKGRITIEAVVQCEETQA